MDPIRLLVILALIGFVLSGRKFLDAWRIKGKGGRPLRVLYGALCLACFVIIGFFQLPG